MIGSFDGRLADPRRLERLTFAFGGTLRECRRGLAWGVVQGATGWQRFCAHWLIAGWRENSRHFVDPWDRGDGLPYRSESAVDLSFMLSTGGKPCGFLMTIRARISARHIRMLQPGQVIWDTVVAGFGVRRQAGPVSYILRYRTQAGRRQRTYTIGKNGSPWTPETARGEALRLLGEVVQGGDPSGDKQARRDILTVAELCDRYLEEAQAGTLLTRRKTIKKESTLVSDRGRIARHIKPLLGQLAVTAVTRDDAETMMHAIATGSTASRTKTKPRGLSRVRGGRGVASRTVGLLGAIFTYAIRKGMRTDNPAHGVMRYADGRRQRRLSDDEYAMLGDGLRQAERGGMWAPAVAATRLLALTGWRRGEVIGLRWSEVDLPRRTARLADTKTGLSLRPLSNAACDILRAQARIDGLVFPTTTGTGPMIGYPRLWARMAKLAKLPPDVTPHVLRHSFASLAADLGYSDATIAAAVGHKLHTITSRYLHTADAVLLAAVDAVAERIMSMLVETAEESIAASTGEFAVPQPILGDQEPAGS